VPRADRGWGPDIDRFDFALEIAEMIGEHRDEGVVGTLVLSPAHCCRVAVIATPAGNFAAQAATG
jgi:hypothetical protein